MVFIFWVFTQSSVFGSDVSEGRAASVFSMTELSSYT
jgi:hypothetical protein